MKVGVVSVIATLLLCVACAASEPTPGGIISTTGKQLDTSAAATLAAAALFDVPDGEYLLLEARETRQVDLGLGVCGALLPDSNNWSKLSLSEQGLAMRDMIRLGAKGFVDWSWFESTGPGCDSNALDGRESITELPSTFFSFSQFEMTLYRVDHDGTITVRMDDVTYSLAPDDKWTYKQGSYRTDLLNRGLKDASEFPALSAPPPTPVPPTPTQTAAEHSRFFVDAAVLSVAFSPDGKTLAVGIRDMGSVVLWDVKKRLPIGQPLEGHSDTLHNIAFSPDGKTLVSGGDPGAFVLWDVNARQPIGQPLDRRQSGVSSVALSPDGKLLASGSEENSIILWDVSDVTRPRMIGQPLIGQARMVRTVAFSPDGTTLASGGWGDASGNWDGAVNLWNVSNPLSPVQIGLPLSGPEIPGDSLAFSPDGRILAGAVGKDVALWDVSDVATPRAIGRLTGHGSVVDTIAFSPDGTTVASGSADKTIILWDVASRLPYGPPLVGHTQAVTSLAFSADGATLASGSTDQTVILWDVSDPRSPVQVLWDAPMPAGVMPTPSP